MLGKCYNSVGTEIGRKESTCLFGLERWASHNPWENILDVAKSDDDGFVDQRHGT